MAFINSVNLFGVEKVNCRKIKYKELSATNMDSFVFSEVEILMSGIYDTNTGTTLLLLLILLDSDPCRNPYI